MSTKITAEVLEQAQRRAAGEEVPVIVTLAAGTDAKALERQGLKVRQTWDSISAVAGTVAPDKLRDLADLDQVELIEYDGEVHALE
jgi:nucleotide-binding universal stress UspA family protein